MKPRDLEELLNARLDRAEDRDGAEALDELIASDPGVRRRAAEYERLARALEELNEPDAPAAFTRHVMDRISADSEAPGRRARLGWAPRVISGGGMVMAKKALIGVATAAAAVLVVFTITGYPHINSSSGTAGTIGAAKRAQAPQIGAADVQTGDPVVQQFLQSDTFDRLSKDPDARKLLSNPGFRSALSSAEMRSALASSELQAALSRAGIRAALASAEMRAALANADIRAALARADFRAALARADLQAALAAPEMRAAMAADELRAALASADIRAALASADLQAALARPDMRAALASDAMRAALADSGLQAALASSALSAALQNSAFAAALSSAQFQAAFQAQ